MNIHPVKKALCLVLFALLSTSSFAQTAPAPNPVPGLRKIIWLWLENTPSSQMMFQHYTKYLWLNYPSVTFTSYTASSPVTQANAMTLIGGTDFGITDNSLTRIGSATLIDLLDAKNIPWKVYAEDFPGACYLSEGAGNYKRYRVPFLSVGQIQADRYQCMKIVGFSSLAEDIKYATLPDFTVIIPNLKNSGAESSYLTADNTLVRLLEPVVTNEALMSSTTIIISTINNNIASNPEMLTMILGQGVQDLGLSVSTPYSHLNLLRTIEDGLHLGNLNQGDARSSPLLGFWK